MLHHLTQYFLKWYPPSPLNSFPLCFQIWIVNSSWFFPPFINFPWDLKVFSFLGDTVHTFFFLAKRPKKFLNLAIRLFWSHVYFFNSLFLTTQSNYPLYSLGTSLVSQQWKGQNDRSQNAVVRQAQTQTETKLSCFRQFLYCLFANEVNYLQSKSWLGNHVSIRKGKKIEKKPLETDNKVDR